MKIEQVQLILGAKVVAGIENMGREFTTIYASDLMSEVLAGGDVKGLLITALTSPQVIRTAEMLDLAGIIFVNNKIASECVIDLAQEKSIPILVSEHSLFKTCGLIYQYLENPAEG